MPQSMTAFAETHTTLDSGTLGLEIRTLNHRFLETMVRLPDGLHTLEPEIREQIKQSISRGKVDVYLHYKTNDDASTLQLNEAKLKQILQTHQKLRQLSPELSPASTTDIIRSEGIIEEKNPNQTDVQTQLKPLLQQTLAQIQQNRAKEGAALAQCLEQYASECRACIDQLVTMQETLVAEQQSRIQQKFTEAQIEFDPARLAQEMVAFAHKTEITEELDRSKTHLAEIIALLSLTQPIGKQIDFYLQELNREANTLGAKTQNSEAKKVIINLKVFIEKMREQAQNVE